MNTSIVDVSTLSPCLEDESDDQKLTKRDLHTLNEQRRRDLIKVTHVGTACASRMTFFDAFLDMHFSKDMLSLWI